MSAYFWLKGGPTPSGLDGLVAVGVLLTAGAALLLRLVAAPYLIWKEDQAISQELIDRLDDPNRLPHLEMSRYRVKLSKRLAEFLMFAQLSLNEGLYRNFVAPQSAKMLEKQEQVNNILWQLGHDVTLRLACWNLVNYCTETISMAANGIYDPSRARRLKQQSRHTMTLIHNPTGEQHKLALAHIEAILALDGDSLFKSGETLSQSLSGTVADTQQ